MAYLQDFDSLHNIAPGKHFYQFYKSSDDFFQVMMSFFQAGLEKGDACLWLVSDKVGFHHAYQTAQSMISGFKEAVSSGKFEIFSGELWYLSSGMFDESQAIFNAQNYLDKIKNAGFKCLRAAGDVGCVPKSDWGKVDLYERKVDGWIKSQPVIALCAYPLLQCTPSQAKNVLESHEDVLVGHF